MHRLIPFLACILWSASLQAQLPASAYSFNCTKDTVVPCGQSCITLQTTVPAIGSLSSQYTVSKAGCFRPNVSPSAFGTSLNNTRDDIYSQPLTLPFTFSFYDSLYSQLTVSTNGVISFDLDNAEQYAQWTIPSGQGSLPTDSYDRAIIMGVYHDIDIQFPNTSPNKQIKYDVTGTAPHRKWVLTFYKVPCYTNSCWSKINNTYQVTLYEGLGLVEVHVYEREICATWNNGNAMIGMQNYYQNKGIMAPGRSGWTNPQWGGLNMNEAWRFAPQEGTPLLKKVELYTTDGQLVAAGDTVNNGNGNYSVSFNNICPASDTGTYLVKTTYKKIEDPAAEVYSVDTIKVAKAPLIVPAFEVQNACAGLANGSITVTNPVEPGTVYSINNGAFQVAPNFSNLPAGTYSVTSTTANGCVYVTAVQVDNGYQINTRIIYPRNVFCETETITTPIIDGVPGGNFSVNNTGLQISPASGAIDIAASDTGSYIIRYQINPTDSCTNPVAETNIWIVGSTQFVWTGAVDNTWENPANWSCNNLPTPSSDVIIYSGNVVINSNVTVNKLSVKPGASVTVNSGYNLTVINPGN